MSARRLVSVNKTKKPVSPSHASLLIKFAAALITKESAMLTPWRPESFLVNSNPPSWPQCCKLCQPSPVGLENGQGTLQECHHHCVLCPTMVIMTSRNQINFYLHEQKEDYFNNGMIDTLEN